MVTPLTDHIETFWIAVRSHINRRMRFLHRLGKDAELWKTIMFALPFEFSAAPSPYNDIKRFREPLLCIVPIVAEHRVFRRVHAAAGAKIQSSARKLIDHGKFFGDTQRIVHGQN